MPRPKFKTVDEYIQSFPSEAQEVMRELRRVIKKEVPQAEEAISYQIPTFKLNGKYLIYFAGFKDHISLYPTTAYLEASLKEVVQYKTGKGTLQFPLDKPLPFPLIRKIVRFKVTESIQKNR